MKPQHKKLLTAIIFITIFCFIYFNFFYRESVLENAIQQTNPVENEPVQPSAS